MLKYYPSICLRERDRGNRKKLNKDDISRNNSNAEYIQTENDKFFLGIWPISKNQSVLCTLLAYN
jgi:hypothetical protein